MLVYIKRAEQKGSAIAKRGIHGPDGADQGVTGSLRQYLNSPILDGFLTPGRDA